MGGVYGYGCAQGRGYMYECVRTDGLIVVFGCVCMDLGVRKGVGTCISVCAWMG